MISIVIGFRNREMTRVKNCVDSFARQGYKDFELVFVDYGSDTAISKDVAELTSKYEFIKYVFTETRGMFWNRSHALNTGIKKSNGDIILLADIDLIFAPDFLEKLRSVSLDKSFCTFNCFYLPAGVDLANIWEKEVSHPQSYVGLCAVKKSFIEQVDYFDEFYMVWGVEDYDFYKKLQEVAGLERKELGAPEFKVYHQWHVSHYQASPSLWYVTMVDKMFQGGGNYSQRAGFNHRKEDRPSLQLFSDKGYESQEKLTLYSNGLLVYDVFYSEFLALVPGQTGWMMYEAEQVATGKMHQLINRINTVLNRVPGFNYKLSSKNTLKSVIGVKDVADFMAYFIGLHRDLIADYYIEQTEQSLLLIICKK